MSLDKFVVISAHDQPSGIVLCAIWRWDVHIDTAAASSSILVYVNDIGSGAILNRKLDLLLRVVLVHRS